MTSLLSQLHSPDNTLDNDANGKLAHYDFTEVFRLVLIYIIDNRLKNNKNIS